MIAREFRFYRPTELQEALDLLSEDLGDVKVLAGGMSLVPAMNLGLVQQLLFYLRHMLVIGNLVCPDVLIHFREVKLVLERLTRARNSRYRVDHRRTLQFSSLHDRPQGEYRAYRIASGNRNEIGRLQC